MAVTLTHPETNVRVKSYFIVMFNGTNVFNQSDWQYNYMYFKINKYNAKKY